MNKYKTTYLGDLRTESIHLESTSKMLSDAPKDNQGEGIYFSPTDLLATSLTQCMVTIMAIKCKAAGIKFTKCEALTQKVMGENPRRITEIFVVLDFEKNFYSDKDKKHIENAALNCPVFKSIHPDIKVDVKFNY
ncbi:MAG: putative redox protein [Sphingobacteriales bacterium]|jgi:putative redox protein